MEEKNNNNFENVPAEEGELSNEELEGVGGGFGFQYPWFVVDIFVCRNCSKVHYIEPLACLQCGSTDIYRTITRRSHAEGG